MHRPSSVSKASYPDWDANINALMKLAQGGTTKASAKFPVDRFKTNVYYMGNKNTADIIKLQEKAYSRPQPANDQMYQTTKTGFARRSSQTSQPEFQENTDLNGNESKDNEIREIKQVIQKIAVHINKLELQQESSSSCTLKRLTELEDYVNSIKQVNSNTYETEGLAIRNEIRGLDQKHNKDIGELQTALTYIRDKLFEKLNTLETTAFNSANQGNLQIEKLEASINTIKSEAYSKLEEFESNLNEIANMKYTDIVGEVSKSIQEQFKDIFGEMLRNGILEYARKKEDEDYRRLSLIDQRISELENASQELNRQFEMTKLDSKVSAKKEQIMNAKNKELDENLANLIADFQAFKAKYENFEKTQKSTIQEYWSRVESGIKSVHDDFGADIAILRARQNDSKNICDSVVTDTKNLKEKLNERVDLLKDSLEKSIRTNDREIEEINEKLNSFEATKISMDSMIEKQQVLQNEIKILKKDTIDSKKDILTTIKNETDIKIQELKSENDLKISELKTQSDSKITDFKLEFEERLSKIQSETLVELENYIKEMHKGITQEISNMKAEQNSRNQQPVYVNSEYVQNPPVDLDSEGQNSENHDEIPKKEAKKDEMLIVDNSDKNEKAKDLLSFAYTGQNQEVNIGGASTDKKLQDSPQETPRLKGDEEIIAPNTASAIPTPFITPDERNNLEKTLKETVESKEKLDYSNSPQPNKFDADEEIQNKQENDSQVEEIHEEDGKKELGKMQEIPEKPPKTAPPKVTKNEEVSDDLDDLFPKDLSGIPPKTAENHKNVENVENKPVVKKL